MNPYQYTILRCVPRPDREEFVNVGIVLHCQACDFLGMRWHVDAARLAALAPQLDIAAVTAALQVVDLVCRGDDRAGAAAMGDLGTRFGFLAAPRSTVLQPGPVHGGLARDPEAALAALTDRLVA